MERVQKSTQINKNLLTSQELLNDYKLIFHAEHINFVLLMKNQTQSESHELFEPKRLRTKQRIYHRWTLEQNQQYITFLDQFKRDFDYQRTRRATKVFKRLAEFMKTKSESQCKSHHQKMLQQYGSIENVISHFVKRIAAERRNPKKSRQTSKPQPNEQNSARPQYPEKIQKKVTQISEITDHDNSIKSAMTSINQSSSEEVQEQFQNIIGFPVPKVNQTLFDVLNQEFFMNY